MSLPSFWQWIHFIFGKTGFNTLQLSKCFDNNPCFDPVASQCGHLESVKSYVPNVSFILVNLTTQLDKIVDILFYIRYNLFLT